jgi:hypothetical protein
MDADDDGTPVPAGTLRAPADGNAPAADDARRALIFSRRLSNRGGNLPDDRPEPPL